eukprot:scaffold41104_cov26-Prasinocladus_malaysianus.AAC.1
MKGVSGCINSNRLRLQCQRMAGAFGSHCALNLPPHNVNSSEKAQAGGDAGSAPPAGGAGVRAGPGHVPLREGLAGPAGLPGDHLGALPARAHRRRPQRAIP